MFCASCGATLTPGMKFCASCGAQVPGAAPVAPAPVPPPSYSPMPPPGYPSAPPSYPGTPMAPPGYSPNPGPGYHPSSYEAPTTSGKAIAGFVLAFLCGVLGLIFSILGYQECKNSNGTVKGEGLALAGIIIASINMFLGLIIALS